ncbi:phosphotransferase family protein [Virgibacillus halodenitrificans]|uniref:Phosphotransferase n=1 Tax=Virgibacillus halodenitrificans TaxID=1482 RepID=A0AAC9NJX5_VIRHA|nr:phosphotransferase family protein [Virgibacillus halodenitrificans]APC47977.1 phosphotransferase [Virgibacillus halodenitrificans]MCG1027744.1 phosphotransferase family protein [Virgibacillus halodenitrificans]MCJ0931802.1 phosphotransferase family protein [Virgibacillus halodenitrificans]MYL44745.1 phosphotransferase [Virgibacillus halodenitrificans]WHX27797.1 phosphotransferase family protein [Virgibacillus halodenitrificans]
MVDWLKRILGEDWKVAPAGGLTGDAYHAVKGNQRLFLKRNSSPFLAVLSAEGIVPKLIWTKRLENGDVITAQEWLEGRELKPQEMQNDRVAKLLQKIHHSSELLHMLMRLGKKPVTSDEGFAVIKQNIGRIEGIHRYPAVEEALYYLDFLLPETRGQDLVVCHGDLNHNNVLLTDEGNLYLIDWDNALIADPVIDYGMVLKWYIPMKDWDTWLNKYGVANNQQLYRRMFWYLLLDSLHYLIWHYDRKETWKVMERLTDLQELNEQVRMTILT